MLERMAPVIRLRLSLLDQEGVDRVFTQVLPGGGDETLAELFVTHPTGPTASWNELTRVLEDIESRFGVLSSNRTVRQVGDDAIRVDAERFLRQFLEPEVLQHFRSDEYWDKPESSISWQPYLGCADPFSPENVALVGAKILNGLQRAPIDGRRGKFLYGFWVSGCGGNFVIDLEAHSLVKLIIPGHLWKGADFPEWINSEP